MAATLESRLTELEVRFAFLDDAVAALSASDAERTQRVLALERAFRDIREELAAMRVALGHDVREEPPPPHY